MTTLSEIAGADIGPADVIDTLSRVFAADFEGVPA